MSHHEFIVDNFTVWVNGDVSKLEVFASICPVPGNQFMVSAFIVRKRRSPLPKFGPLSIGTLFWRLAWLLPMHCVRQSSNACYGT